MEGSLVQGMDELREKAALAHRILTATGSMGDNTGHVMVRVPGTNNILVRCRGEEDWSPGLARPEVMHMVDLDGNPAEEMGDYLPPPERHIACAVMRARPEVQCVVHAHPPAQILCSITDVPIRPILGCANWGGMMLAQGGIPVYQRSILVASPEISGAMMAVMGSRNVCLLKAHGNVVTGGSIEQAISRSIAIENLAKVCWEVAAAGKEAPEISQEDLQEFLYPTQEAAKQVTKQGGDRWTWNYYLRMLNEGGTFHVEHGAPMP
jgi:ribulose-5-phosphate 4-epimerase/fuculose-1-phosphate aldolase